MQTSVTTKPRSSGPPVSPSTIPVTSSLSELDPFSPSSTAPPPSYNMGYSSPPMSHLGGTVPMLEERFSNLELANNELRARCTDLESRCSELSSRNQYLEMRTAQLEQRASANEREFAERDITISEMKAQQLDQADVISHISREKTKAPVHQETFVFRNMHAKLAKSVEAAGRPNSEPYYLKSHACEFGHGGRTYSMKFYPAGDDPGKYRDGAVFFQAEKSALNESLKWPNKDVLHFGVVNPKTRQVEHVQRIDMAGNRQDSAVVNKYGRQPEKYEDGFPTGFGKRGWINTQQMEDYIDANGNMSIVVTASDARPKIPV